MPTNNYNPPSRNPSDDGTLAGMLRLVLTKFLQGVDDMLPARVIAYDRATNRASVQPLIAVVTTANMQVTRAPIASVPVLQLGGGNFFLSFPINPGDLGWIKANDRDISLFKEAYDNASPNTQRKHSFEDALFIPDVMRGYTINAEDADNVVLSSLDGTVRVAIWGDKVKITAPEVILDTPVVTVTGIIDVQNSGSVADPCTVNGNIVTNGDVVASGISLVTHVHSGVQSGGSNTGAPV